MESRAAVPSPREDAAHAAAVSHAAAGRRCPYIRGGDPMTDPPARYHESIIIHIDEILLMLTSRVRWPVGIF